MKVVYTPITRGDILDRNPAGYGDDFFSFNIAPHGSTSRLSYNIPAGKRFLLNMIRVFNIRLVAAGTAGNYLTICNATLDGNTINLLYINSYNNVQYVSYTQLAYPQIYLAPGDNIEFLTQDGSTGGNISYGGSFAGILFDA